VQTIQLFNNLLKKKQEDFVAINLGNYYLKGVVVSGGKISEFFLKEKGNLQRDLNQIWQEKKIATNRVKISIKDRLTLVRYFSFPRVEKKKLRQVLFYELNKHIPFAAEEVYFDFSVLEENPQGQFLLLAVAKKELINNIIDTFEKEKKEILEISLDSICLVNVFLNYYKELKASNICILDIGHDFSTLSLLRKATPFITRDLTFGMKDVLGVISHVKNIANPASWIASKENHKEFLELSQDNLTGLWREVKSSFDYFEVNKGERIDKLYLTGGLAYINGIDSFCKEHLDTQIDFLDNLLNLKGSLSQENFSRIKHSMAAVSGLAI
jgi:type IV pilus assembly protein PilM